MTPGRRDDGALAEHTAFPYHFHIMCVECAAYGECRGNPVTTQAQRLYVDIPAKDSLTGKRERYSPSRYLVDRLLPCKSEVGQSPQGHHQQPDNAGDIQAGTIQAKPLHERLQDGSRTSLNSWRPPGAATPPS